MESSSPWSTILAPAKGCGVVPAYPLWPSRLSAKVTPLSFEPGQASSSECLARRECPFQLELDTPFFCDRLSSWSFFGWRSSRTSTMPQASLYHDIVHLHFVSGRHYDAETGSGPSVLRSRADSIEAHVKRKTESRGMRAAAPELVMVSPVSYLTLGRRLPR